MKFQIKIILQEKENLSKNILKQKNKIKDNYYKKMILIINYNNLQVLIPIIYNKKKY